MKEEILIGIEKLRITRIIMRVCEFMCVCYVYKMYFSIVSTNKVTIYSKTKIEALIMPL